MGDALLSAGPVERERVRVLNERPVVRGPGGRYVLYWIQASQRERHNPALEYAIHVANELDLPVLCCFGLMDDYPEANARHYAFMLQGLKDLKGALEGRGIKLVGRRGSPPEVALGLAREAAVVVTDRGYLRHQKAWRARVAQGAGCRVVEVEGDVVVPVEVASGKAEYAARTLRPKVQAQVDRYVVPLARGRVKRASLGLKLGLEVTGDLDLSRGEGLLEGMKVDRSVGVSKQFVGGQSAGGKLLEAFVSSKLEAYDEARNEPSVDGTSWMSMYLHFGMVSPVEIALAVRGAGGGKGKGGGSGSAAYLEELIVRRELSVNFCHYRGNYDSYGVLPDWARKTLAAHAKDRRPVVYTREELEAGRTGDVYWNAAQLQMVRTGFMHNYMRMYWGKKILEWTADPEAAFETTLYLNNRYFLCGRSPNAYANVAWIFGQHDRPWGPERPIFGLIRYMNAAGLKRKFDMDAYVKKVALLG